MRIKNCIRVHVVILIVILIDIVILIVIVLILIDYCSNIGNISISIGKCNTTTKCLWPW